MTTPIQICIGAEDPATCSTGSWAAVDAATSIDGLTTTGEQLVRCRPRSASTTRPRSMGAWRGAPPRRVGPGGHRGAGCCSARSRAHDRDEPGRLDLQVGDERRDAEVERLTGLDASRLCDGQQGPHRWLTMADPEGNEFCVGRRPARSRDPCSERDDRCRTSGISRDVPHLPMNRSTSTTTRTLPAATRPPVVGRRDGERDAAALDLVEHGLGDDLGADRRRLQVIDLDPHADRRGPGRELRRDRVARRLLAQGDEPRRAEHVDGRPTARRAPCRPRRRPSAPRPGVPSPRSRVVTLTPCYPVTTARRSGRTPRPSRRATGRLRPVIDQDVIERVLSTAMRSGGGVRRDLRRGQALDVGGLDDGRIEQVTQRARPRRRHPCRAGRDHRVRPHQRPQRARAARPPPRRPRQRPGRAVAAPGTVRPHTRRERRRSTTSSSYPDEVPKTAKVELLRRIDDAARSAGASIVQVSAGYADSRKRVLVANTDGLLADDEQSCAACCASASSPTATPACRPASSRWATRSASRCSTDVDVEELARDAARQAITKLDARPAPSGTMPVVIKQGTGGVLFHEACGHGLEADLVGKGASVYRGKGGELVASPLVTLVDDGTMAARVGHARDRRRRPPDAAQRADRGRRAHRLHVGLPAGPQGGSGADRQRPPPELHAPADGADDEHVRARTAPTIPTTSCAPPSAASTSPSSAAAASTPPPATSCSA